jgi:O-methyltransferase domain
MANRLDVFDRTARNDPEFDIVIRICCYGSIDCLTIPDLCATGPSSSLIFRIGASLEMLHSLKTGESAFRKTFGAPLFDYLSAHPEYATKLFRAMSSISAARMASLLEAYDFSRITKLIDLGAAHGAMAAAIAKRYPSIRCTCFDLPHAEQGTLKAFRDSGVADRCDFVGGDFFEDVPVGADAYLLSAVLHDWGNEQCLHILRNCRRRVPDKGKTFGGRYRFGRQKKTCPTPTAISWT